MESGKTGGAAAGVLQYIVSYGADPMRSGWALVLCSIMVSCAGNQTQNPSQARAETQSLNELPGEVLENTGSQSDSEREYIRLSKEHPDVFPQGINIGYLYSAGWYLLNGERGGITDSQIRVTFDASGVWIDRNDEHGQKQYLGQLYFDKARDSFYLHTGDSRGGGLEQGVNELGFMRVKLITVDGREIHIGHITC